MGDGLPVLNHTSKNARFEDQSAVIPKGNKLSIFAVAAFATGLIVAGMFIAGTFTADAAQPVIGDGL
jgi:hypothetical protein